MPYSAARLLIFGLAAIYLTTVFPACDGGDSSESVATSPPVSEVTVVTSDAEPLDTETEDMLNIEEDCFPLGSDTDEVYRDDIYADLIMEPAQIQDSDLPADSISRERSGVSLHNNGWNDRLRMVKKDPYPLARLEELRGLGVLGQWFNSGKLPFGTTVLMIAPDASPQHFVEVHTLFFDSQACAYKFLEQEVPGEELLLASFPFETKALLSRSQMGEETETELALVVPPKYVIWLKDYYRPASEDIDTVIPGYSSDYPEKAAQIREADSPDFVNIASLAEILAIRLWEQVGAAGP